MTITELYKIDGAPMYAPDRVQDHSFEDLDASDSGRDESGVMHRVRLREKVGVWSFCYTALTETEKQAVLAQFAGRAEFDFTHPGKLDSTQPETCRAYMSKYGVSWFDAVRGQWRNLKFNIIEC